MTARVLLGTSILMGHAALWLEPRAVVLLDVETTVDGEIIVNTDPGVVTITIDTPPEYAGTYTVDTTAFSEGPVALKAPLVSGTVNIGDTLTAIPGLWAYDTSVLTPPAFTRIWQRDGMDIPGATDLSYTLATEDEGRSITLRETGADTMGSRISTSAPQIVPGQVPDSVGSLFAAGQQGFVLLPGSVHGICYQERTGAAATTLCTDGDPVGTYHDLVTGQYATAPSDARRMIYRTDGQYAYFEKPDADMALEVGLDASGSDEMMIASAVTKGADTGFDILVELGPNTTSSSNPGSISQAQSGGSTGTGWTTQVRGTSQQNAGSSSGFPLQADYIVTSLAKISVPSVETRVDGLQIATNTGNLGSGTFADATLYIGTRGSATTDGFKGKIHGIILRTALPTEAELTEAEAFLSIRIGS